MEEIEMIDEQKDEALYALVDVSTLEGTSFLKRAPIYQIYLWGKIYGMEGKITLRLDLISAAETLQYLYWNSTQLPPIDDLEVLVNQCAELSTKLAIDETSVEELTSRIPPDVLKSAGDKRREEEKQMGQGSTTKGTLEKTSAKNPNPKEATDKAAEKAAKLAEKQAAKDAKAKAAAEAKEAKLAAKAAAKKEPKPARVAPLPRPPAAEVEAVFKASGETGKDAALAKAQAAFLAQPVRTSGKRDSDPHAHAVSIPIKQTADGAVQATLVSMVWFAAVVTGMSTSQFYRRDAIGLIQKLGLVALHEGKPVAVQQSAEARAEEKAAKIAEKEAARVAKKAEREAAKVAKAAEVKAKADAIATAAQTGATASA